MQKYEMLILLGSELEEEAREAEIKKYSDIVVSFGGVVDSTDNWGVKKTAYPIAYKSDAYYVLMTFHANGDAVKELDRVAGISGNVMRRMITKAEE